MIYTEDELQNIKKSYTSRNFFQDGYNNESEFILNNIKYKLDEKGYLSFPNDVICTPSRITIKK